MSKWENLNVSLEDFPKCTNFKYFKEKIFNLTENAFESCNLIHFNNGVFKILIKTIIIFLIIFQMKKN
jgi:hypothetical protein